jgi:hypothetical protein
MSGANRFFFCLALSQFLVTSWSGSGLPAAARIPNHLVNKKISFRGLTPPIK